MILETSDSKGKLEKVFSREKVNQSCKIQVKTVEKTKRKLSKLIVVIQVPRFKRERENCSLSSKNSPKSVDLMLMKCIITFRIKKKQMKRFSKPWPFRKKVRNRSFKYRKTLEIQPKSSEGASKVEIPQPSKFESSGNNPTLKVIMLVKYHKRFAESAPADNWLLRQR